MRVEYNGYKLNLINAYLTNKSLQVSVPDSWVKGNKLKFNTGNGEAKLYVGSKKNINEFFESDFIDNLNPALAFVTRDDIIYYLESAEFEYNYPQQEYRKQDTMVNRYKNYIETANTFEDIEYFNIIPHNGKKDKSRFYIDGSKDSKDYKNRDKIYNYLREILLPQITAIQIINVIDEDENSRKIYWFRPYIQDCTKLRNPRIVSEEENKINSNNKIKDTEKKALIKSRVGQGIFRKRCLTKYNYKCVITGIDQKEVLEACHIKPWMDCNNDERLNTKNSIVLNATLHKLFDLGFISFDNNHNLMCSSFLTKSMKCYLYKNSMDSYKDLLLSTEYFLKYHRENIYRD